MIRGVLILVMGGCLLAAGCNLTTQEFLCATDNECPAASGGYGACVRGHCAFRSDSCASGWVYDETGGSVANTCVPESDLNPDAGPSGPDAAWVADAAPVADAGPSGPDAAPVADAGPVTDAGPVADAGPPDA